MLIFSKLNKKKWRKASFSRRRRHLCRRSWRGRRRRGRGGRCRAGRRSPSGREWPSCPDRWHAPTCTGSWREQSRAAATLGRTLRPGKQPRTGAWWWCGQLARSGCRRWRASGPESPSSIRHVLFWRAGLSTKQFQIRIFQKLKIMQLPLIVYF